MKPYSKDSMEEKLMNDQLFQDPCLTQNQSQNKKFTNLKLKKKEKEKEKKNKTKHTHTHFCHQLLNFSVFELKSN